MFNRYLAVAAILVHLAILHFIALSAVELAGIRAEVIAYIVMEPDGEYTRCATDYQRVTHCITRGTNQ